MPVDASWCGRVTFTDLPVTVLHRFDTGKSYESIDVYRDGGVQPLCREWDHKVGMWSATSARIPGKEDVETFYSGLPDYNDWLPYPPTNLTHWLPPTKCKHHHTASSDPSATRSMCGYNVTAEYYSDHIGAFVNEGSANITLTGTQGKPEGTQAAAHFDCRPSTWPEDRRGLHFNRTQSSITKVTIDDPDHIFAPLCQIP